MWQSGSFGLSVNGTNSFSITCNRTLCCTALRLCVCVCVCVCVCFVCTLRNNDVSKSIPSRCSYSKKFLIEKSYDVIGHIWIYMSG